MPTCGANTAAGLALQQAHAQGWDRCVVIAGEGTVIGILRAGRIGASERSLAAEVMQAGPATVRAHEEFDATWQRMRERHVAHLLVTTPDGALIGVVDADDAG